MTKPDLAFYNREFFFQNRLAVAVMFLSILASLIAISSYLFKPIQASKMLLQAKREKYHASFTILAIKTSTQNNKKEVLKEALIQTVGKETNQHKNFLVMRIIKEHFSYINRVSAYLANLPKPVVYNFNVVTIGFQVAFDVKSKTQGFNQHK